MKRKADAIDTQEVVKVPRVGYDGKHMWCEEVCMEFVAQRPYLADFLSWTPYQQYAYWTTMVELSLVCKDRVVRLPLTLTLEDRMEM